MIKTPKIHVFGNVILFLNKVCFACVLVVWYIGAEKTFKSKFLVKIGFIPMKSDCPAF